MVSGSPPRPSIWLISRQRIVGKTNGSSAYIISIADYLKSKGFRVHYISPSPATFGRWPVIRLQRETDVFDSYRIRGSIRLGRLLLLPDVRVLWRAAIAVLDQALARTRLWKRRFGRPAANAIMLPLSARDAEFLVANVRGRADALILDYAFLTPCIKLVAQGETPSIVIMHDLVSAVLPRLQKFTDPQLVPTLSEAEEMELLSAADLVVAIQEEEAVVVRDRLPEQRVIVAPMSAQLADNAFPGDCDSVLFVGSNTVANVDGLSWFIEHAWPRILERRPSARLIVAGSVAWSCARPAPRVDYLGIVSDLSDLYRRAGVVISPLRVGSGLKVKLVEALGWGKAMVVTPTTLQGVEGVMKDTVLIAEEAEDFANKVLGLMENEAERAWYAGAALRAATTHFGRDACYRPIFSFIAERTVLSQRSSGSEPASLWQCSAGRAPLAAEESTSPVRS